MSPNPLTLLGVGRPPPAAGGAGIAFDAASSGTRVTGATSLTFAHTCTGSDRILLVGCHTETTTDQVSGVTYAGVAMTRVGTVVTGGSERDYLYALVNPATGSNNVVVSTGSSAAITGSAASYTGAKQSGQPDASNTGSSGSAATFALSVTTVADNCWVVSTVSTSAASATAGASTTRRTNPSPAYGALFDSNGVVSPAGSRTLNHAGSGVWGGVIASVAPA